MNKRKNQLKVVKNQLTVKSVYFLKKKGKRQSINQLITNFAFLKKSV